MRKFGYVRVSSRDQNPDRQLEALRERGVLKKNIYIDRMSGKDFNRPAFETMRRKMTKGDLLIILSIDRLGRNYSEILKQWRELTYERGIHIEVIDMPLLNTNCDREGLTGRFIADMVLQVLAYVAETERTFIKQRQAEGIALALERGVHFGAVSKEVPSDFPKYYRRWVSGEISVRNAAKELNMSPSRFYRRCKEMNGKDIEDNKTEK